MKKVGIIISVSLLIVIIGIILIINNTNENNKTFTKDGIIYALTLDGERTNVFPEKGMYKADVSCSGATGKWLYDEWTLAIENINSENISCNIDFTTIETTYLNNYIISLSGTTQGNGQVVEENGYRYEGKNPNNYIWFNNELWRIIGVFDSESHGQSGENLVKIIRNESIGGLAWNKSNNNNWSTSSLMNLLNGAYLNSQDGTGGEYCYGYSTSVPGNCNYREIGIKDTYRQMIREVTWYLGGYSSTSATTEAFYGYERSNNVYGSNSTSWEGYIGLMYPSDFGYSVLASNCARSTNLSAYSTSSCGGQSWLDSQGYAWTIMPFSSNSTNIFYTYCSGRLFNRSANYGHSVLPVLYLDTGVYIMDGNGTITNPYVVSI